MRGEYLVGQRHQQKADKQSKDFEDMELSSECFTATVAWIEEVYTAVILLSGSMLIFFVELGEHMGIGNTNLQTPHKQNVPRSPVSSVPLLLSQSIQVVHHCNLSAAKQVLLNCLWLGLFFCHLKGIKVINGERL